MRLGNKWTNKEQKKERKKDTLFPSALGARTMGTEREDRVSVDWSQQWLLDHNKSYDVPVIADRLTDRRVHKVFHNGKVPMPLGAQFRKQRKEEQGRKAQHSPQLLDKEHLNPTIEHSAPFPCVLLTWKYLLWLGLADFFNNSVEPAL